MVLGRGRRQWHGGYRQQHLRPCVHGQQALPKVIQILLDVAVSEVVKLILFRVVGPCQRPWGHWIHCSILLAFPAFGQPQCEDKKIQGFEHVAHGRKVDLSEGKDGFGAVLSDGVDTDPQSIKEAILLLPDLIYRCPVSKGLIKQLDKLAGGVNVTIPATEDTKAPIPCISARCKQRWRRFHIHVVRAPLGQIIANVLGKTAACGCNLIAAF